ncbi:hypothetical protein GCM10010277_65770 [Streptomyces longisporoflavus]|uniref:hypothetical protein n=1 Tax=Streptomyces longisporoflavus TaxID=28044 RepID=UPI00167DDAF5|nr:hypothetical protein [Streptomyces longisporoflavus]GGV61112.1 hypothetical protein GCM10010277_65770 [Streptomyces longisporoflavus]
MGTKTEDEAAAKAAAKPAEPEAVDSADTADGTGADAVKVEKSADVEDAATPADRAADHPDDADELVVVEEVAPAKSGGVFQGAAAVVSAALGVIGLSGGWLGTVAADRSNIVGQLEMQKKPSTAIADQIQALYGDSWQITALIAGAFALAALVVGFIVLVRPAFGAPGQAQASWIKSVAWAGVSLGVIGLLLAIAKYSDLIYGLPSAS